MALDGLAPRPKRRGGADAVPTPGEAWAGRIADDPTDDGVEVTLDAYGPLRFGPAPYMPRGATEPTRGDRALVVFDDGDEPWVVTWWPS